MLWSHLCKGIRKSFWNNRNIKGKGEINGNFIIDYVFRRKRRFSLASSWRLLNTNSSISLYIELDSGYMCLFYHCCSALSHVWLSATPWTAAGQASLSLPLRVCSNSCPLSQWFHPTISSCLSLLLLPKIFPTIWVFSNDLALCIRWPKY